MDFIEALLKLSDQYGLTPVLAFVTLIGGGFMVRGMVSAWNKVTLSNADGRNKIETSTSSAIQQLADSNHALALQLNSMVAQNNATLQAAQAGSLEQSKQFNKSLDRMDGMIEIMNDSKKLQRGISETIGEVADKVTPMQTDLKEVRLSTAGMPSVFTSMLDERFAPVLALFIGMNTQVNAIAATLQTLNQTGDASTLEITAIKVRLGKLISELALFKELFFDRDDHLGIHVQHILTALTTKESTP